LPVQHEAVTLESQSPPDLLDFIYEPVDLPQRVIFGLIAECGLELVVVVVLDAGRRQIAVAGLEVPRGSRQVRREGEGLAAPDCCRSASSRP
jgi:hypothetical protein